MEIALIISTLYLLFINKLLDKHHKEILKRDEELKRWLFNSLYSINNKVVLPEKYEEVKKEIQRKAKVYSPEDDPFSEFNGNKSDELHRG